MEKIQSFKPFRWEQHGIHQVWNLISFFVFLFKHVFIHVGVGGWELAIHLDCRSHRTGAGAVSICSVSPRNWAQANRLGGKCLYQLSHLGSLMSSFPDCASWSIFCRSPNRLPHSLSNLQCIPSCLIISGAGLLLMDQWTVSRVFFCCYINTRMNASFHTSARVHETTWFGFLPLLLLCEHSEARLYPEGLLSSCWLPWSITMALTGLLHWCKQLNYWLGG